MKYILWVFSEAWKIGFCDYTRPMRPVMRTRLFYRARHRSRNPVMPLKDWLIMGATTFGLVFTFGLIFFSV